MQYYFEIRSMLFRDHLNNTIEFQEYPQRIISIVPSQSELLWDLGLQNKLIGITKFCIHPKEMFTKVERVGGTKKLDIQKIKTLNPDIIIGNKEENEQSQILELQKDFKVWMSDIYTLKDALKSILDIGLLTNTYSQAQTICEKITADFSNLKQIHQSALYLIWYKPFMAAGKNTFIGDILNRLGFRNCLPSKQERYPELNISMIKDLNPEIIFLSSEPYPFKEEHIQELQKELPLTKIHLVDGELFSWYGSRLLKSAGYFNKKMTEWA